MNKIMKNSSSEMSQGPMAMSGSSWGRGMFNQKGSKIRGSSKSMDKASLLAITMIRDGICKQVGLVGGVYGLKCKPIWKWARYAQSALDAGQPNSENLHPAMGPTL